MCDVTEFAPHVRKRVVSISLSNLLLDRDGQHPWSCSCSPPCPASMGTAHPAWPQLPGSHSGAMSVAAGNPGMMISANQTEHTLVLGHIFRISSASLAPKHFDIGSLLLPHSFPSFFPQHCVDWALGFLLRNLWKWCEEMNVGNMWLSFWGQISNSENK